MIGIQNNITGRRPKRDKYKPTGSPNMSKTVKIDVLQSDIDQAIPCDPYHCMIELAAYRAIRVPHGYIHVDIAGIKVTRQSYPGHREFAPFPQRVREILLMFDESKEHPELRKHITPFSFRVTFQDYAKIVRREDQQRINARRRERVKNGEDINKVYGQSGVRRSRAAGLSISVKTAKILEDAGVE